MSELRRREKSAVLMMGANLYALAVSTILPFVVRTLLIRFIGIEYVGVSYLFSSVLQVLNVADFGLTTALAWFLYKPAEVDDRSKINACMVYFRKLFRIVGLIILIGGLAAMPLIPWLVKGKEYPAGLNIYVIYLVYILNASLPYLTNNYLQTMFPAYLIGHINYLIGGSTLLIMYLLQILSIVLWRNFYLYTVLLLVSVLLQVLLYLFAQKKSFPWLDLSVEEDHKAKEDLKERMLPMFLSKIRNVSRNSLDGVIVSLLFGLPLLAEYQNYYQVMLVPLMMTVVVRTAVQPSMGNRIALESPESNYDIIKQYIFIINLVATVCGTCLISLIQPFMKLWVGADLLLGQDVVIGVTVYYYVLCVAEGGVMLREITGIWREGRWVALLEAGANLVLNILLAKYLGLFGVILATILTVGLINIPLESFFVFRGYFKGFYGDYIRRILIYGIEALVIISISYFVCIHIEIINMMNMIIRIAMSVIVPGVLFVLIHIRSAELRALVDLVRRFFLRKQRF